MLATLTPFALALRRKMRRLVQAIVNYATTWSFAAYAQANGGALPGPWADVRRTGTATYENASGVITTLPDLGGGTYAARVQYRSGTARGLLIEGQATQLASATQAFDTWTQVAVTVDANAAVSPDGAISADRLRESATTAVHYITKAVSPISAGTPFALSLFLKADGRDAAYIETNGGLVAKFNLTTGAVTDGSYGGASITRSGVEQLANGWRYCWAEGSAPSAATSIAYIALGTGSYAGDGTKGVLAWQFDCVASAVHTSPIPNNASSGTVVRAGDFAGVFLTSTALSAAFPQGFTQNTIVFKFRKSYSAGLEVLYALSAGSAYGAGNGFLARVNGTNVEVGGNSSATSVSGQLVLDGETINTVAVSWDTSITTAKVSVNGSAVSTLSTLDFSGVGTTHLTPGALMPTGGQVMGRMEIVEWYVRPGQYITGASLQALSA